MVVYLCYLLFIICLIIFLAFDYKNDIKLRASWHILQVQASERNPNPCRRASTDLLGLVPIPLAPWGARGRGGLGLAIWLKITYTIVGGSVGRF